MFRFPNRTSQAATYHTGSPDYVDVSAGAADAGMQTFAAAATAWSDGDQVSILIFKAPTQYAVWLATWDATNSYLLLADTELAVGTLSDADAVTVSAVTSDAMLGRITRDAEFVEEATTTRALSVADNGQTIRCTSADAVTITCTDTLPPNFHCLVIQEGLGIVSITPGGSDTLNGGTDPAEIADQYKSAYIYQPTEAAWVVVA